MPIMCEGCFNPLCERARLTDMTDHIVRGILYLLFLPLCLLGGCAHVREERCIEPVQELCRQDLIRCFGEEYKLSSGVEKERRFFEEHEQVEIITHYTQWELTWEDTDGEAHIFTFTNRSGGEPKEQMGKAIDSYFSELIEEHYGKKFWNQTMEKIPGVRMEDSAFRFRRYRQFSTPKEPKTQVMIKERLHYHLQDHIYFPQLRPEKVCEEFPYLFQVYVYAYYQSEDEGERETQRQRTEEALREMADEMIDYTDGTLNGTVRITMIDREKGATDSFGFAVLKGAYFPDGIGLSYEIALHENFFGPIA